MTSNSEEDPLVVLDKMFNEVLIHTGKAVRAMSKERSGSISGAAHAIKTRTENTMETYHFAVNDLESEIVRAKAVLMRDLEKLRAARVPAPTPTPAAAPAPVPAPAPAPQPHGMVAQASATGLPSAAAHTTKPPPFVPNTESKPVAPFPDMGTGDVVDLTMSEKKPSPRMPAGGIKPSAAQRSPSLLKSEVKRSPKASPKATNKATPKAAPKAAPPAKVTPVPPPQIPRLQPPQPPTGAAAAPPQGAQPQAQRKQPPNQPGPRAPPAPQAPQAPPAPQDAPMGPTPGLPPGARPGAANGAPKAGELNFTDMQFSLAPSVNEPQNTQNAQNAPPAPMPEFDLTKFAPQGGNNQGLPIQNFPTDAAASNPPATNGTTNAAVAPQASKEAGKPDSNLDDLFNLDNGSGGDNMDLDLDLGTGGATDSNFDELFSYTNDADMGQFDNAYFGLE